MRLKNFLAKYLVRATDVKLRPLFLGVRPRRPITATNRQRKGVMDACTQRPKTAMNDDGRVATLVATNDHFENRKPAFLFRKTGSKTGGMDGTRTNRRKNRESLRLASFEANDD